MKRQRTVYFDRYDGRRFAALMVDGQLHDVFIDPKPRQRPEPGAIYRARIQPQMKGHNGVFADLGGGRKAWVKNTGAQTGAQDVDPMVTLQISGYAEAHKAPPARSNILFKSRFAILTPRSKGMNVSRKINDAPERLRLKNIGRTAMEGMPEEVGMILRSSCQGATDDEITKDIMLMKQHCAHVCDSDNALKPGLLLEAPDAVAHARQDWFFPEPDAVFSDEGCFELAGIWDQIDALRLPDIPLAAGANMTLEQTAALVAVDVNTGTDGTTRAGEKANMAAATALPRQLRLRGLGGQVVIDFAPMLKGRRPVLDKRLKEAFAADPVETFLLGWTKLGHFELQRKNERAALADRLD